MSYKEPVHKINGKRYTVVFVAGGWWYLRDEADGSLWRSPAVELRPRMVLTPA